MTPNVQCTLASQLLRVWAKITRFFVSFSLLLSALSVSLAHADVVIGVTGPFSGNYTSYGEAMLAGVNAAVDEINKKGGINGELVNVKSVDDGCDNRQAAAAAKTLIDSNVILVVGHFCTFPTLAAAKLYDEAGVPIIVPSSTLPVLTDSGISHLIRLSARDDNQAVFAAKRMVQYFAADKIAVLSDGSPTNAVLTAKFLTQLGTPSPLVLGFKPDSQNIDELVSRLTAQSIQAIYCACAAADAGLIVSKIKHIAVYGPDTLLVPQFWEVAGASGEGTLVSFAYDPASAAPARRVINALEPSQNVDVLSYAAVQIFAEAAKSTGLRNGSSLVAKFKSGYSFHSIIGEISFDAKGDVQPQRFVWYKWSNGNFAAEQSK